MKVALAILLLACQGLNGNVVRRKDASPGKVYPTSENVKKKAANSLNETNTTLEPVTEDSNYKRMSGALKIGTESKEHDNGTNHAYPNISQLKQHGENVKTSIPRIKKPGNAHYESGEKFDSRMARDADDDESDENVAVDPDDEENKDEDKMALMPAGKLVKPGKVPIFAEIKEDAFKPVDIHIYVHLDDFGRKHVSRNETGNTCSEIAPFLKSST